MVQLIQLIRFNFSGREQSTENNRAENNPAQPERAPSQFEGESAALRTHTR